MKSKGTIKLSASGVRSMIKDLNLLVVSMDHMGSTYYNNPRKLALESDRFFHEVNAFKILAQMRGVLSEAYKSQSTKADALRLEGEAEKLPFWQWKPAKVRKKL